MTERKLWASHRERHHGVPVRARSPRPHKMLGSNEKGDSPQVERKGPRVAGRQAHRTRIDLLRVLGFLSSPCTSLACSCAHHAACIRIFRLQPERRWHSTNR